MHGSEIHSSGSEMSLRPYECIWAYGWHFLDSQLVQTILTQALTLKACVLAKCVLATCVLAKNLHACAFLIDIFSRLQWKFGVNSTS